MEHLENKFRDQESIGYLTALVSQAMSDSLRHSFMERGIDLPHSQFLLLAQLFIRDGQTQQQIADNLHKDKGSIKRTVDSLIEKGFLERRPEYEGAKKSIPLYITPSARALECEIMDISSQNFSTIIDGISPREVQDTKTTLRKMMSNIKG